MTLVKVWCSWLCERFQYFEGVALSHSHSWLWMRGSRIQSHCPCMMLCPSSMFSRILATDRPAVPSTHAGGKSEKSSTARLPISRPRCHASTLRMYAASAVPRDASTSWRKASSSAPMASMSSALRWAAGSGLPDGFGRWVRSVVTTESRLLTGRVRVGALGVPAREPSMLRSKSPSVVGMVWG